MFDTKEKTRPTENSGERVLLERVTYLGPLRLFRLFVAGQVSVGLSVLSQFGFVIDAWGHPEAAFPSLDVGFDIGGSFNLL